MNSTVESRLYVSSLDAEHENSMQKNIVTGQRADGRFHYMDNLRALAMIGGVFFHAALAYSPASHNIWLTSDREQSAIVDVIAWFTHLFRMPLFFIIAGFFVAYLVGKRGMGGMLKNRAKRILLPLLIFLPLCTVAVVASLMAAAKSVQHKSPVLELVAYSMANPGTSSPPPTTMHLWFLYNLLFFCLLAWVFCHYNWSRIRNYIVNLKPLVFIAFFPLLLIPALSATAAPVPAPDSLLPQLWSFGFYGVFFTLGYWIFTAEKFIEKFKTYCISILLLSLIAYVVFYFLAPKDLSPTAMAPILWKKIICTILEAYISVWMAMVCLVMGKMYLNSPNRIMRFFSDSSYWIYIIHLPVLLAIQYKLMDTNWSLLEKYSVSLIFTLAVGIISYLLLVRWTPIGWMLNGRKSAKK